MKHHTLAAKEGLSLSPDLGSWNSMHVVFHSQLEAKVQTGECAPKMTQYECSQLPKVVPI